MGGGAFVAITYGNNAATAGPPVTPTVAATESTIAPSTATSSKPTPAKPTATSTSTADTAARKALRACQSKVGAADDVMAAAKVGNAHWATHVQAQTDANRDKISVAEMSGLFKQTRLEGPSDQRKYADSLSAYQDLDGSCSRVKNASKTTAAKLAKCAERADALKPVLAAGADSMKDWKTHLAAMQRNRDGHVSEAQDVWIRAWRAAPPHIDAFDKAVKQFDAPAC